MERAGHASAALATGLIRKVKGAGHASEVKLVTSGAASEVKLVTSDAAAVGLDRRPLPCPAHGWSGAKAPSFSYPPLKHCYHRMEYV